MKTPEDIKKGLECCMNIECPPDCPYFGNEAVDCNIALNTDAVAAISQLERERDEAWELVNILNAEISTMVNVLESTNRKYAEACKERDAAVDRCASADDVSADYYHETQQLERDAFLKPLDYQEAMCDDAFLEVKGDEYIDAALNLFACGTVDGSLKDGFIFYKTHDVDELKLMEIDYNKKWRCWSRRPTDEERAAAKWEVE